MKRFTIGLLLILLLPLAAMAQTSFRVEDIRVEGLQRVSAGTVFAALPISVGDTVDGTSVRDATRALFRTGFFADIGMARDGNVLVINVEERPAISEINLDGNKALKTEDLMDGLERNGLSEGQIFKQATLEGLTQELQRQYVSQGRYNASVDTEVVAEPGNRVRLDITIDEGDVAKIKHINIVGNRIYEEDDLLEEFELQTTGWWSWISGDDKYSREKMQGDLERLESYYLDRGYLQFNIDSTQIAISPDKTAVYITVNVTEGEQYTVSGVELAGDLVLPQEEIRRLILMKEGTTFSQVLMTKTSEYISQRLGNEGYTFSEVRGIPEVDEGEKTVKITFFVDPGQRVYVRRINFRGNTKTADDVLRREMRQMESASANAAKIEQGKVRLERLGFFKEVKVENIEVPGNTDMIDVEYTVEEQPSGSIGASIGYAQGTGLVLGANVQQSNFLGTGKKVGFGINNSQFQTSANFSFTDPYYTVDGVSRGFNVYYIARDFEEVNVASFTTDSYGLDVSFGYPLSEIERLGFSIGYSNQEIETGAFAVKEITASPDLVEGIDTYIDDSAIDFTQPLPWNFNPQPIAGLPSSAFANPEPGFIERNGNNFDQFPITLSWSRSTLNRGVLATRGSSQRMSLEVAVPGSDLQYFKMIYSGQMFQPLTENLTLRFRTRLGYGDGYGSTEQLPFFENFYAGGFGSVRGFARNTIGPRSTPADAYSVVTSVTDSLGNPLTLSYVRDANGNLVYFPLDTDPDPFGGNILVDGSMELIFPVPFVKDQRSVQSALFFDAGNAYSSYCSSSQVGCFNVDLAELRYSVGVGLTWISGFGPLTFSVSKPLKKEEYDEQEIFQFSLGTSF